MKKAVGYTRVSLEEMAEHGVSLDMQTAEVRRYAERRGFELVDIVVDAGRSGKDLNREGIQAVIKMIAGRKVDALVVYRQDRLTRNVSDALNLSDMFRKKHVTLHTVTNQEVETESADGEFRFGLDALLSQRERKLIAERTRAAMGRMREKGQRISGQAPYGYRFDDNRVVQDEQEQAVIRTIQKLSDNGLSVRKIAAHLVAEGVTSRKGKPLGLAQVHAVIKAAA